MANPTANHLIESESDDTAAINIKRAVVNATTPINVTGSQGDLLPRNRKNGCQVATADTYHKLVRSRLAHPLGA